MTTNLLTQVSRLSRQSQAEFEMWVLHKILSSILHKPRPTKPFCEGLSRTFWQNLTRQPQKFSTEGRRAVIFRRKYKQFAKIDAKLVTVGMYSDLWYTS